MECGLGDIERAQLKGNASEEELRALEIDKTNKSMLLSWRATRFEIVQVLRKVRPLSLSIIRLTTYTQTRTQVVDEVLKDDSANDQELCHRARGLSLLGTIFESTVPDESEEDNRELEQCAYLPPHPAYMLTLNAQGRRPGCQVEEQTGAERRYAGRAGPRAESCARNASWGTSEQAHAISCGGLVLRQPTTSP